MSDRETVDDPQETLAIQNVVASTGIGHEVDLQSVAMDLEGSDYDPEQFPGLIYRPDRDGGATSLIFRSGKITCTGAESVEGVHEAVHATFADLRELGIQVETPGITVQNIVSDADLGETLNLEAIAIGLGLEDVEYEPEQFPGLIYWLDAPDLVVLLFGSGKMVITGATERAEAEAAVEAIVARLTDLNLLR